MKKLKIIEKSRFLENKEMSELYGGITCTPDKPYKTSGCDSGWIGYISCTPAAVSGYTSTNCNGIGDLHSCGSDMNFSISSCFGWQLFTSNCSGGVNYSRP